MDSLIFGAMTAIGVAAGPIIGGLLATYASWRWAFCLGAVVVIFVIAFSFLLKGEEKIKGAKLDYIGLILSASVFASVPKYRYNWCIQISSP